MKRRSGRKRHSPSHYVPTLQIRNRASPVDKKSCRRQSKANDNKRKSVQKRIVFRAQAPTAAQINKRSGEHETNADTLLLLRGCRNTSPELFFLLKCAVDVVRDFGTDVKVEFPRYQCLSCKQYFALKSYRKVSLFVINDCNDYCKNIYTIVVCTIVV